MWGNCPRELQEHFPWISSKDLIKKYAGIGVASFNTIFAWIVSRIDEDISQGLGSMFAGATNIANSLTNNIIHDIANNIANI